ncbi:MAG: hypothetical protein HYZ13_09210 [Acidobacteria bacterium]|nr:hypothetical protein [Acidobacteriota bacterium]
MGRFDAILARLRALLPPPPPMRGWRWARLRAEAAQLASGLEPQVLRAQTQLRLGATLLRIDGTPGRWEIAEVDDWRFRPVLEDEGAEGRYLDAWGRALAVPRVQGEPDPRYARRILVELVRPSTTNLGMAQLLDETLEIRGTQVLDAWDALRTDRFNQGRRFSAGVRVWGFEDPFATLAATFVVVLPLERYGTYRKGDLEALLERRRAAGTRLLRLATTGLPVVDPPVPDLRLPRPSRFGQTRTRFHQPRAFEPIRAGTPGIFGRFNEPVHVGQGRRFAPPVLKEAP